MSRTTYRSAPRRDPAPAVNWLVEGAFVAGLGLAAFAMLVLLLWITSPYPDSGPGGALRVAAGLWLLAHGAELVRTDTLTGAAAPVGVTPLLLTVLPVFLLYRVARAADGPPRWVVCWLSTGYLLVAGLVAWYSLGGPIQVEPLSAALRLPLLTVGTIGAGVWVARCCPAPPLPGWARWSSVLAALRAAGVATGVLCGGGALLVVVALVWHWNAAADAFPQLTAAWSGRVAVMLLCLVLLPNAAVWGAAYGLGPGFTLGAGSTVGPLVASGYPQLPHFPLFAAVPGEGHGDPVLWAVAGAVPLAAGLAAGWYAGRASVPLRGSAHGAVSWSGTALITGFAGAGCGGAMVLLAAFAGGPLGTGTLADFGPNGWLAGAAAVGWTALVAAPVALVVRLWRLREPNLLLGMAIGWRRCTAWCAAVRPWRRRAAERSGEEGGNGDGDGDRDGDEAQWHATGSRRSRWAALKRASGGLMPDFEPRGSTTRSTSPTSTTSTLNPDPTPDPATDPAVSPPR